MTIAEYMFVIFDFLRTNSQWQIIGSGDGTSGGMGTPLSPIDVYDVAADWNYNNFWFVWQLGTALQMLVQRVSTAGQFEVYTNLALDYTGGGATTRPTSPSGSSIKLPMTNWLFNDPVNAPSRLYLLCEDGATIATAGWFAFSRCFLWGELINGSSMGFIPLSNVQTSDQHPYVMAMQASPASVDGYYYARLGAGESSGLLYGIDPANPTASTTFIAAGTGHYLATGNFKTAERNSGQSSDGADWHQACIVMRPYGQYKGLSTFMRRSGTTRVPSSTYDNLTRISFGAYSMPWDGVSVPEM
jgi:hypothetical protein